MGKHDCEQQCRKLEKLGGGKKKELAKEDTVMIMIRGYHKLPSCSVTTKRRKRSVNKEWQTDL